MHAAQMEDIETIYAGYIGALFGIDCASGDSFVAPGLSLTMTSMYVPEPVISLAIFPKDNKSETNVAKALGRFTKEDPTFKVFVNPETGDTVISGMGELHLDVYIERMRREYQADVTTSAPRVAYRETITQKAEFDYIHKKQTGGAGQFGRVAGYMEPVENEDWGHRVPDLSRRRLSSGHRRSGPAASARRPGASTSRSRADQSLASAGFSFSLARREVARHRRWSTRGRRPGRTRHRRQLRSVVS